MQRTRERFTQERCGRRKTTAAASSFLRRHLGSIESFPCSIMLLIVASSRCSCCMGLTHKKILSSIEQSNMMFRGHASRPPMHLDDPARILVRLAGTALCLERVCRRRAGRAVTLSASVESWESRAMARGRVGEWGFLNGCVWKGRREYSNAIILAILFLHSQRVGQFQRLQCDAPGQYKSSWPYIECRQLAVHRRWRADGLPPCRPYNFQLGIHRDTQA